ncbi:MAG: hypothetical protein HC890_19535, partial [Chloroflexaceae bacterium]|nr:hypothetical protein [Chloroflexaceae bacterium]
MVSANQQSALLLPKLKDDCDVRSGKPPGEWDYQQPAAFNNIASSLDYRAPGETKSVSSVPTIWARPLSVEMALHNDAYPIREQVIPLWQGMLAAIALAEVRGLPLQAKLLQLAEKRSRHAFARSAWELLPDATNALYTLKDKEPWEDIYLFSWSGQPVGMTSPSTLVVPSEEGKWTGLPWWNGKHLEAPHRYLNDMEKVQLASWLDHLGKEVRNHSGALRDAKGNSKPIDRIIGLINSYIDSLGARVEQNVKLSDSAAFFGEDINRGSLIALNRPVKAESQESNVRLVGSLDKSGALPLLIVDAEIARYWNETSPSIWVYRDRNLASLRPEDIKSWQESREVICLESKDLFLPELGFIDKEAIFPGGLLPEGAATLTFNGNRITPLIPLNPILLNYFTPEDLIRRLKFSVVGSQVNLAIDLPLSGVKGSKAPQNYRVTKSYPLKEENALEEVPVLEVWPNFRTEGWKEYYGFYYDAEFGQETFKVNFPDAQEIHEFREKEGSYQLVRLEQ